MSLVAGSLLCGLVALAEGKEFLMSTMLEAPVLGEGAYTFPEALKILQGISAAVSVHQLRQWIATGLAPVAEIGEGSSRHRILSFDDLVTLAIIGRFRNRSVSLQRIRRLEVELRRRRPDHVRPFAYKSFFTDGASIWVDDLGGDESLSEVVGKHRNQRAWTGAIRSFAEEIRFGSDLHAQAWDLSPWVELDPQIQFGRPVVRGTRVPVRTVIANLEVGTPKDVADWYGLTVDQVIGARDYVAIH